MKWPEYSKYTPSCAEWLGDMPAHWNSKRLKYLASINDEALPETTDAGHELAYVDIGSVDSRQGITTIEGMVFEDAPSRARRIVRDGDTIISTVRTYLRAIAPIVQPPANMIVSTGFAVVRPRKLDSRYLSYALRESGFVETVVARSVGVSYPAVNASDIGIIPVLVPDVSEQRAISDFLDRETATLDALIGKKRALIGKLKEKRAALISRTVTHGLPPDAAWAAGLDPAPKLKPSGVDWIDQIPSHWVVKRLRHISDGITVGVVVNPSSYVSDEGVPFLLGGDVKELFVDISNAKRCPKEVSDGVLSKSRLKHEDLVVVRVGYPGVAAVIPEELEGANCASMMIVRRHKRFCSQWLAYVINSRVGRDQVEIVQYGAAQKQFNISHAVDFSYPFPPVEEQNLIANFLDRETAKIDRLIRKVGVVIERLLEYRSALITAAVTGKIDVRNTSKTL